MMIAEENAVQFANTERANGEYNRRMAAKRYQNTLHVKRDLEKQIEEKNRQMVSGIDVNNLILVVDCSTNRFHFDEGSRNGTA